MEKRETIYYRAGNSITFARTSEYESKEYILEKIKERGYTLATKKEYDTELYQVCFNRVKQRFEAKDIGGIVSMLENNDNRYSIKAFSVLSGVKLSPTMRNRMRQVKEYYGVAYEEWEREKQEEAAEEERKRAEEKQAAHRAAVMNAETQYHAGKRINGKDFLLLCDEYHVDMHIRTRGFIKKSVTGVENNGYHWLIRGKKTTQGFSDAWRALNEAMGIEQKEE